MNLLYNFSYDYEKTFNSSLISLSKLYNTISENKKENFSIGFNSNFIKSAIADKISNILIFLSLNLIIISLSWRLRSNYLTGIPKIHLLIILAIPFFISRRTFLSKPTYLSWSKDSRYSPNSLKYPPIFFRTFLPAAVTFLPVAASLFDSHDILFGMSCIIS